MPQICRVEKEDEIIEGRQSGDIYNQKANDNQCRCKMLKRQSESPVRFQSGVPSEPHIRLQLGFPSGFQICLSTSLRLVTSRLRREPETKEREARRKDVKMANFMVGVMRQKCTAVAIDDLNKSLIRATAQSMTLRPIMESI